MTHLAVLTLITLATFAAASAAAARPSIEQQIRRAFAPYGQSSTAVCIAYHESTLRPAAYYAGNYGLFQINWSSHPYFDRGRLYDAAYNIAAALRVYLNRDRSGVAHPSWRPWSTRGMCGA